MMARPTVNSEEREDQTYVLNSHLQPVPIGVAGNLYIGGLSLSHNRRYLANPFAQESESKVAKNR
ncbi:MAG: hypothetical protein HC930_16875 [Hydrococcus sp. SU_1_0]|nr:hypothetical protein [Hydrococcus sp. SU_1_0]